ncbi:MAG: ABC transporter substrate-binding protein [Candidatus Eisenbacteria bacterium]|nr:ABC transporter substrate-binding protein [Candidatus Eisenbacteria bacterium]
MRPSKKAVLALFCALSLVVCACAEKADVIKIGEYGSLTGTTATFGKSTDNGIQMAIEEINSAGGIGGKKLLVIVEDDQGKPEEANTAVTKLVNQDRVAAVLGEVASSRSLAGAPVCQKAGVPMITPSSTNPKVTQVGDYIFRVCFIDPFQGTVMAKFARDTLNLKKAAILKDIKNDYSVGLADFFAGAFEKLGGTIVGDESYSEGDIDFKAQLTSLRAKKPDVLFIPGYYTEVGLIAKQARDLNFNVPLLGGDGWSSPKLTEIGGEALQNSYYSDHYSVEDQNPVVQQFAKLYQDKYHEVPRDGIAALAYDAAKILAQAMKTLSPEDLDNLTKSGKTQQDAQKKLRDAIASTKDFQGVTGTISLDENRNAVKPAVILKYENGVYRYLTRISP